MKQLISLLLAIVVLTLSACGGGNSSSSDSDGYTVESGVAQKGPLAQGSNIFINELSTGTYLPNGKQYTFQTTDNFGKFTPKGITYSTPYLSTLALGYYFNEITGAQSNDMVSLRGLSQIGTGGDSVINVNVLSSMTVIRTSNLATTGKTPPTFAAARLQAQKELLKAFRVYNAASILTKTAVNGIVQPANLTALDLSLNRAGDQLLAAVSAMVVTAGTNGSGINTLLSQITNDLADDGLLNNSPSYAQSAQSLLCAAAASTDFAVVATNLNKVYGTNYQATDLSQWVDTSGCVDQVINKYKFNTTNVALGTVIKSPNYTVGADDLGQCFSVGGVTANATAGLYYNNNLVQTTGTQIATNVGDTMVIGIYAAAAGSNSAYLQRSAPLANKTCPDTVPTSGLTRVQKQTIKTTASLANIYPVGCTNGGAVGSTTCATGSEATNSGNPYVAVDADAGQCISVSNGAKLYKNGATTAVSGSTAAATNDRFVVGITLVKGTEVTAYIQRSPMITVGGVASCPSTIPLTSIVPIAQVRTSALQLVTDLASNADTAYSYPLSTAEIALANPDGTNIFDDCYLDGGNTKTISMYNFQNNVTSYGATDNDSALYKQGSKRSNIKIQSDVISVNGDGTTRRIINSTYDVAYLDGSTEYSQPQQTIVGSSYGSQMAGGSICQAPQVSSAIRFFGNRAIVSTSIDAVNWMYEQNDYNNSNTTTSVSNFVQKAIRLRVLDPGNNASYAVVIGQGLPSTGIKVISPRITNTIPGRLTIGNLSSDSSFKLCTSKNFGNAAFYADCSNFGMGSTYLTGQAFYFNSTDSVTTALATNNADTSFAALGFAVGAIYTYNIYNDDGWKYVNGQAGKTPVATYTQVLKTLPYSAASLPTQISSYMTRHNYNPTTIINNLKNNQTVSVSFTPGVNPTIADSTDKFGFGAAWTFRQGPASGTNDQYLMETDFFSVTKPVNPMNLTAPSPFGMGLNWFEVGYGLTTRNGNIIEVGTGFSPYGN